MPTSGSGHIGEAVRYRTPGGFRWSTLTYRGPPAHAAQRVREARDRLTSTSGTRPAFDTELLRQYAQTRMSASYVVMLLVVATGVLFGVWMQPLTAAAWTVGMLCIHIAI